MKKVNQIEANEIKLLDEDNKVLGVISTEKAFEIADERNLDLVEVNSKCSPPIYRIMNYNEYENIQFQKMLLLRKSQKVSATKEIRISPSIGEHDLNFKVKNARKFLERGDKVKVTSKLFRRRAILGEEALLIFAEALQDISIIESKPTLYGKVITMLLTKK